MAAITISITTTSVGQDEIQTANARDLHRELGVGKDFSTWIKAQIDRAALVENEDFVVFTQKGGNLIGGRPTVDYHLTFDSAKHIAMMSGTPKGKEVRKYFIECERRARPAANDINPASFSRMQLIELAMQAEQERIESEQKRIALELKVEVMAPKAEALDRISAGEDNLTFTQAAKVLSVKRDSLTQWLHANGWVYRQNGSWVAYDAQIHTGRLAYKEAKYTDPNTGQEVHKPYCHITPKGLAWLAANGPKKAAA
jgi:anti-repressor protein